METVLSKAQGPREENTATVATPLNGGRFSIVVRGNDILVADHHVHKQLIVFQP
jgi:hypothetical protein